MKRVTLRVESLDGRFLPSASPVGIVVDRSKPGVIKTSNPFSNTGAGIELFGSKPVASAGSNSIGETNTAIELLGTGSKPGGRGDGVTPFGGRGGIGGDL